MYGFKKFISERGIDGQVINAYMNNPEMEIKEIAKSFNKSPAGIYRTLQRHDLSPNRMKMQHEKVKDLSSQGWTISQIAEFTGYTPRNVRYILKNLTEG